MSKTTLKKALRDMSREDMVEVLCELYDSRREAKEYLDYWADPHPDELLEDYKNRVDKMFFYSTGKNRSQPAAADLKRLEKYFSSLVFDPEKTADLLLHIAERQYLWLTRRTSGFNEAEKAVRRACDTASIFIEEAGLEAVYGLRLGRVKESIDEYYRNPPEPRRTWWKRRRW